MRHGTSLNSKYLHFYGQNKMSKNNEIQRKSEHKIAFCHKMTKMHLRPSCIQLTKCLVITHCGNQEDKSVISTVSYFKNGHDVTALGRGATRAVCQLTGKCASDENQTRSKPFNVHCRDTLRRHVRSQSGIKIS